MKLNIRFMLFFFCIISLPCETLAKCALQIIMVKGKVQILEKKEGNTISKPAVGATVIVFIDESKYTIGDENRYPDVVAADDGTFTARGGFWQTEVPYYENRDGKEVLIAGKCLGFPQKMEIIVSLKGFLTQRVVYKLDDYSLHMVINQKGDLIVELPPIELKSN